MERSLVGGLWPVVGAATDEVRVKASHEVGQRSLGASEDERSSKPHRVDDPFVVVVAPRGFS